MRRVKLVAVLPTLMTLGNGICGFGAITLAAKLGPGVNDQQIIFTAGALIFVAMLFDMLDGAVARLMRQTSDFGAQLDSLCDVISFGVAPAMLMIGLSSVYHPRVLWVVGVLYLACVTLRLARFNVETPEDDSHEAFSGLPSPAAAGTVAAIAISIPGLNNLIASDMPEASQEFGRWTIAAIGVGLPVITLLLCGLMVSRFRYPHVINQMIHGRRSFQHLVQLVFAIVAVIAVHELAVPLMFLYFAFAAPARASWWEITGRRDEEVSPEPSN